MYEHFPPRKEPQYVDILLDAHKGQEAGLPRRNKARGGLDADKRTRKKAPGSGFARSRQKRHRRPSRQKRRRLDDGLRGKTRPASFISHWAVASAAPRWFESSSKLHFSAFVKSWGGELESASFQSPRKEEKEKCPRTTSCSVRAFVPSRLFECVRTEITQRREDSYWGFSSPSVNRCNTREDIKHG